MQIIRIKVLLNVTLKLLNILITNYYKCCITFGILNDTFMTGCNNLGSIIVVNHFAFHRLLNTFLISYIIK